MMTSRQNAQEQTATMTPIAATYAVFIADFKIPKLWLFCGAIHTYIHNTYVYAINCE